MLMCEFYFIIRLDYLKDIQDIIALFYSEQRPFRIEYGCSEVIQGRGCIVSYYEVNFQKRIINMFSMFMFLHF